MFLPNEDSLFAHRGLHDEQLRRNSLPAIVAAADAGYGIEFDVHLTADGLPIVSHDPDTAHDTGVRHVIERTPWSVLRDLRFSGTDVPLATLDDVMANVPPTVPLLIEIKPTRRMAAVVDAVASRVTDRVDRVALQSFHPGVVLAARRRQRHLSCGQLVERPEPTMGALERWHSRTLWSNLVTRPQFLAFEVSMLAEPLAQRWRARLGVPMLAWTVRTPAEVDACRRARAGLIFEGFRPEGVAR